MNKCTTCKKEFLPFLDTYTICILCWYEKIYGNTLAHGYKFLRKDEI